MPLSHRILPSASSILQLKRSRPASTSPHLRPPLFKPPSPARDSALKHRHSNPAHFPPSLPSRLFHRPFPPPPRKHCPPARNVPLRHSQPAPQPPVSPRRPPHPLLLPPLIPTPKPRTQLSTNGGNLPRALRHLLLKLLSYKQKSNHHPPPRIRERNQIPIPSANSNSAPFSVSIAK